MRGLRRITAVLFVVSSLFPVVAGLLAANPPRWLGIADVIVAALLAAGALTLAGRAGHITSEADLASGFALSGSSRTASRVSWCCSSWRARA